MAFTDSRHTDTPAREVLQAMPSKYVKPFKANTHTSLTCAGRESQRTPLPAGDEGVARKCGNSPLEHTINKSAFHKSNNFQYQRRILIYYQLLPYSLLSLLPTHSHQFFFFIALVWKASRRKITYTSNMPVIPNLLFDSVFEKNNTLDCHSKLYLLD